MLGTMYEETENKYQAEALFDDLIEQAYLEALIDGEQQSLAYCWLRTNHQPYEH
jgi:hypothetical protein